MDVLLSVQCVACDVCIGLVMLAAGQVTAPKQSWRTCMGGALSVFYIC